MFKTAVALTGVLLCFATGRPATAADSHGGKTIPLAKPVHLQGTISFVMRIDRSLQNGRSVTARRMDLLTLDGLGRVFIEVDSAAVTPWLRWEQTDQFLHSYTRLTVLPGPEAYFVQFTWDAERGLFDTCYNGYPTREIGSRFEPWRFSGQPAKTATLPNTDGVSIADLEVSDRYTSFEDLIAAIPKRLLHAQSEIFQPSPQTLAKPMTVKPGPVLYSAKLAEPQDVHEWVMEGLARFEFRDGWMELSSEKPEASGKEHGHFVFWCPKQFPDRFIAEWDVQVVSEHGLCIVFFAAHARDGGDVLGPGLKPRNGAFEQYINGDINSYHISYFSDPPFEPARLASNLRKNPPSHLLSVGPIGIAAASNQVHRMRLIKDGSRLQLQRDGQVVIDYADDNQQRYGSPFGAGQLAFRQMQWTTARYRDLVIRELE